MVVYVDEIRAKSTGELDFIDITKDAREVVARSKVKNGVLTLFVPGATGAIVLNENESNIIEDFKGAISRLAPSSGDYKHGDNARSHIRAMILGPSEAIPVKDGSLEIGTWQSIFLVELDVRPRNRVVSARVVGTSAVHEG
jgi:secondary thiamine-phosphate synthase enzyme